MTTAEQLTQVFNDNFVTYFRSHAAHVNIMGRNFTSDHKLLGGIYERRQEQIDVIAELLRSIGAFMPTSIGDILEGSHIGDYSVDGDADDLLTTVRDDLEHLKECYQKLNEVAEEEEHDEISNYAQEQILDIAKSLWMLDSTLNG